MTITHLQNAAAATLSEPKPVSAPLGEPVPAISYLDVERADQVETGIWEATPGRWARYVAEQEFCHFIAGHGTFTPEGGAPIAFKAGDAFMMSENTRGIWDIQETVRKTYVIIKR
ncbi:cupin domain-containing protein [Acidisoma silvae]|uniref:Cupin domain-containing protein n=1 Tax=Acidisoma silvae TaxID=2802396 RepID=A0A963YV78_9PROT|nr:cupin domain-containing protein [Acidisoma silvae]MCB8877359.1 cupin domain-containing protein [Acidisoma silvae]